MRKLLLPAAGVAAAIALSSLLFSNALGVPGPGYATSGQGCGQVLCHGAAVGVPGGGGITITVAPTARSLTLGQAISVNTKVTGGAVSTTAQIAGFNSTVTRGRFTAGAGTQVGFAGTDITHTDPLNRTWTYGYTASTTLTGLVNMFVVCNTANGDNLADPGDIWAFHGYDATSTTSTPVRLYVNAARVRPFGSACVGSYGQYPVLGAPQAPNLGSSTFSFELVGAPPSAPITLILAANTAWTPLDLSIINVPGCFLHVDPSLVQISSATSAGGNAQRAEGTASLPLPIPSDPALAGLKLQSQIAIIDFANGRPLPLTMTNALEITLQ